VAEAKAEQSGLDPKTEASNMIRRERQRKEARIIKAALGKGKSKGLAFLHEDTPMGTRENSEKAEMEEKILTELASRFHQARRPHSRHQGCWKQ
jgi:hypothetical protein